MGLLDKRKTKESQTNLNNQIWIRTEESAKVSICGFHYFTECCAQAKGWKRRRKLKATRTLASYRKIDFFGEKQMAAEYVYACYCSNLKQLPAKK